MKTKNAIITLSAMFFLTVNAFAQQLSIQTTQAHPTCNGYTNGAITIDIAGGTAPYSVNGLEISGSQYVAADMPGGGYSYTITDATSNSVLAEIVLVDPQPLSVQVLITNATTYGGNDGSANVTVLNGPVTYNWSGTGAGFIPNQEDQYQLTAGIYNLELTQADGCSFNKRVIIEQPTAPMPSVYNPITQGFQQNNFTISQ